MMKSLMTFSQNHMSILPLNFSSFKLQCKIIFIDLETYPFGFPSDPVEKTKENQTHNGVFHDVSIRLLSTRSRPGLLNFVYNWYTKYQSRFCHHSHAARYFISTSADNEKLNTSHVIQLYILRVIITDFG